MRSVHAGILAVCVVAGGCATTSGDATSSTITQHVSTSTSDRHTTTTEFATTTTSQLETDPILVLGNWGSGTLPQGAVAGAMARHAEALGIEAILTTGDNFYSDDADLLMHPYDWAITDDVGFWITWGDHDVESEARIGAVNEVFSTPPRWDHRRWGSIDIIILDSNQVGSDEQVEFLIGTMAASERPTIVVFHHPPFSCGRYDPNLEIQRRWVSIFDEDVFLVLSGHDHNYQRFSVDEVTYIISGGGGQRLYEIEACPTDHPSAVAGASLHHFVSLAQSDSAVTIEAIDVNGETIDRATVELP